MSARALGYDENNYIPGLVREPGQGRTEDCILEPPLCRKHQARTIPKHVEPEKNDLKMHLACQRMSSGVPQTLESHAQKTMKDSLDMGASQSSCIEVTTQELQYSKVWRYQIMRCLLAF